MRLFVDTGAFIALQDASDSHHLSAAGFLKTPPPACRFVTSNFVVDETITFLRRRAGYARAAAYADSMLQTRLFDVVTVDPAIERAALDVFKRFKDKELSFTDCVSIALVRSLRMDGVFGFDSDFRSVGLRLFPKA